MTLHVNRDAARRRILGFRIVRGSCLAALSLGVGLSCFAPAASGSKPPKYELSIVEGETTLPEFSIANTSGSVEPRAPVVISIVRGGLEVARSSGDGGAWMSQVPQPGDVVILEAGGIKAGTMVYDGLPSIAPTVCAGSTNFSGQNSPGETVKGSYYTETPSPYSPERVGFGRAQVTMLSGTSFGGGFLYPLALGQTVAAVESLETPLAGEAVFRYSSETVRPVGACPLPPTPPPPPPPPPALQGSIFKLSKTTIRKLLKSGWPTEVTINQPGTVVEDLYELNGTLPASAASAGKRHPKHRPPALLLARGTAIAKSAGTVHLTIHPTARGRRTLKHARNLRAVLIATLRSDSGAKLTLPRRPVTLHR